MTEITPEEMHSRIAEMQRDAYVWFGPPETLREEIEKRVLRGLDVYGHANHLQPSKANWINEPLEELMDAFTMCTSLRESRGEKWLKRAAWYIVLAMETLDREQKQARTEEDA